MTPDFVQIHNHSTYSKFDGFASIPEMVKTAKSLGMTACGLTDHGTFAGAIEFLRTCRKEGIRPILGMEAYLSKCHTAQSKDEQPLGRRGNRHINLIAKNYIGFQNVCALSQAASLDGFYYDPRLDADLLWKHREGVIATSACLSNLINTFLADDQYDLAKKAVAGFKDIYGEDFYLEMMFHGIDREARILPDIQRLARDMDVKIIITNDCLLPHSLILTSEGYRRIESLSEGDAVITHRGRLRPIEYVNSQLYDGKAYEIHSTMGSFPVSATANHPFLINKTKGAGWSGIGEQPEWVRARDIQKGDLLCIPKRKIEFAEFHKDFEHRIDVLEFTGDRWYIREIDGIVKSTRIDKEAGVPRHFRLDRHFCQVLGLFLAEGYIDKTVVGFGLHKKEQLLRDIICSFFERFNFHPTVTEEGNGIRIRVNSFVFAAIFKKLVGNGSKNKKLPSFLLFSEQEMQTVIRYYFEGDGSMNNNGKQYMVGSCSEGLIWELSNVLRTWNILTLPTKRDGAESSLKHPNAKSDWNDLFVLNFSGKNLDILSGLFGIEFSGYEIQRGNGNRPNFFSDDSYFYVRVKEVREFWHTDKVWNIQVAQDESYVCSGYAVHNCHYIRQEDAEFHEAVMCISSGRTLKDPKRLKFPYKEFYFKSKDEMAVIFGHLPRAMNNTLEIAEKCDYSEIIFVEEGGTMKLPKFDIPSSSKSSFDHLEKIAKDGLVRLGLDKSEKHVKRLELELSDLKLIWDTKRYDFSTYFLIVEDIMRFAKKEGINAGVRGSALGSFLLKCIGIVEGAIDPLKFGLLWERLMGFDDKFFFMEDDFGPVSSKAAISGSSTD